MITKIIIILLLFFILIALIMNSKNKNAIISIILITLLFLFLYFMKNPLIKINKEIQTQEQTNQKIYQYIYPNADGKLYKKTITNNNSKEELYIPSNWINQDDGTYASEWIKSIYVDNKFYRIIKNKNNTYKYQTLTNLLGYETITNGLN